MKKQEEELINDVLLKLSNELPKEQIQKILDQIRECINDYSISKKSTEIVVYEGLPKEYQLFMVSKKIEGRSEGTLALYKLRLEDALTTIQKPLSEISSNDIRVYLYQFQKTRGVSDRTLDNCRLILNNFFRWCWEESYIPSNPCSSIKPIHYESKPREPISDIEMEKLRQACKNTRESAIIETFYSTGCRCSELSNLLISDINFETREVKLFGKGKKHRTAFLSARAVVALKKYLKERGKDNCPYLIRTIRRPYTNLKVGGLELIVHNIGERAKVSDVFPHRIRHTFATDALEHGMTVQDLQSLLGHSSIDTTLIYAKINPTELSYSHKKYII